MKFSDAMQALEKGCKIRKKNDPKTIYFLKNALWGEVDTYEPFVTSFYIRDILEDSWEVVKEKVKHEGWINIFKYKDERGVASRIHLSKDAALNETLNAHEFFPLICTTRLIEWWEE